MRSRVAISSLVLLSFFSCATAPPRVDLASDLLAVAEGGAVPEGFRVRADWLRDGRMMTAELFGNGAGTLDDETAFRIPAGELHLLGRSIERSGFAAMPGMIGDTKKTKHIRGKLTVSTGRTGKTVVQLLAGHQSEALAALAAEVITIAQNAARSGQRVESLSEGLRKLREGDLPLEALRITAQRRDDRAEPSESGWLLRVRGREATARSIDRVAGYGRLHRVTLTEDEGRRLVTLLAEEDVATLPNNLYAPLYTDLRVDVLNQSKDLQARRYSGVTAETHGARQAAFDRIYDALHAIAARAVESGDVVPAIE
jgi:hypothetical protein